MTTISRLSFPDLTCRPRFGTERDFSRATLGPAVGKTAALLGKPFMPWQQYVADVSLEIDSDTGRLVYDEFGLTVPRQSGKSTFVLAKFTHRCTATSFFGRRQHLVYTAQTRAKAREKWEEDYAAELEASRAFASRVTVNRRGGDEHLRFQNGSRFGIEANTEKAGHGGTLDEAYIDEAFAQVDFRLEQAFGPAMITRANKMLGWISTAGWLDASPYLEAKVELGRNVVDDRSSTIAYFDWSAPPDCDPSDEDVWRDCMPALGYTVTLNAIRSEYRKAVAANKLSDFKRAYLNIWVPKGSDIVESVIPMELWRALSAPTVERPVGKVAFAVDSTPSNSATAISVAGARADGATQVQVVEHRPGQTWAVSRVVELSRGHDCCAVVIDPTSTAGALIGDIEAAGVVVVRVNSQEVNQACTQFYNAAIEGTLRHLSQPELDAAITGASKRELNASWAWNRKNTAVDITPLVSATNALWGWTTRHGSGDILSAVW